VLAPLSAVITLNAIGSTLHGAFAAIGVVGLVNVGLSLGLLPALQKSLSWLMAIADPAAAAEAMRIPAQ
jgi:hypothetical protein